MKLNRRHFQNPRLDLFPDFDRLFQHAFGRLPVAQREEASAGFDVFEDEDAWTLRTDLPGFEKSDVNVSVEEGVVTLQARRDDDDRRFYAGLERSFRVPRHADPSGIEARLDRGILELVIPKVKETDSPALRIEVK